MFKLITAAALVALGDREGACTVRYVAVPREELAVYRTAVIQNPLSAPLLPGPVVSKVVVTASPAKCL